MMSSRVWLVAVASACDQPWLEMEPGRVCDDVGYAISARTFECLDDEAEAQRRFDGLREAYDCLVDSLEEPIDRYYHCPVAINAMTCAEVRRAGDDLSAWLDASASCAVILAPVGEP
jgi:hypothetical protein